MLDLRPYLRQPLSTISAVASDPVKSWMRFWEQYLAHREGHTQPELYKAAEDWESRLHGLFELPSPGEVASEFWA